MWTEYDNLSHELIEEPEQTPEEEKIPKLVNLTIFYLIQMIRLMSIFLI